ncbi:type I secretion system permease/ATPase [uncultured Enterovirga sp.]|uniref:type I secretion system permease/ATPase n=1 Tax=uncultured Enterovirga sp. TaxID=2026352 RepID=UPI0035CC5128
MSDRALTAPSAAGPAPGPSNLSSILLRFRGVLLAVAAMSGVVNVLYLTGSFFMLQVYDRVIPSRSFPTLIALSVLALALFAFQGVIDFLRGRVLVRMAGALDAELTPKVFGIVTRMPLRFKSVGDGQQPLRDLDTVRNFLIGAGLIAFFDLPWIPIYLFFCFMFHPAIGWTVVIGAILLGAIAFATEVKTRGPVQRMSSLGSRRGALAEAGRRNAEVVNAMGMGPGLTRIWGEVNDQYMSQQQRSSDVGGGLGALTKFFRMVLQSGVLALGAYLVIEGQASGGIIIASSILTARALAPVELAIANWRGFVGARQGAKRLFATLAAMPDRSVPVALPVPSQSLRLEAVSVTPPGVPQFVVQDVSFSLKAGQGLGIIGPSASGKSSLARAIVGAWPPTRGKIRLDGGAYDQWEPAILGQYIGYLPQDVELFAGTVADNIARFAPVSDDAAVIDAARKAGVHDLILRLPDGYGTAIGEGGAALSAGQRQRIGLARALHGDPFLIVLDEPNSNLDQEGEEALTRAIAGVRERNGIVIVVAHRGSALAAVDQVMVMADGRVQAFGPKEEVLQKLLRPAGPPLTVVGAAEAGKGRA